MSYQDSSDKASDEAKEAAKRITSLDKEKSDYDSAVKGAREP